MKDSRFFLIAWAPLLAICGSLSGCGTHAIRSDAQSLTQGIAAAVNRSDLNAYTKKGCLESLKSSGPTADPHDSPPGLVGGMFFLGDSWLSYSFFLLSTRDGQPFLTQSLHSRKARAITASELDELIGLIVAARYDVPPAKPVSGLHNTCIVFLDSTGTYFVARPDEAKETVRPTDKAIEIADRLSKIAP